MVKSFNPNEIEFEVYTDKTSLFVISEMHYPPGWHIFVDDQQVQKIYKTDHALQSVILPEGHHKVQAIFEPESYQHYVNLSYASAGILYLIITFSLVMMNKEKILKRLKANPDPSAEK
jgi:uncharacterized membrane protein YfhO